MKPEVIYIDPNEVKRCTPASQHTDLNQHDGNRDHPHAFFNRGYFVETKRAGQVLDGDWDIYPSPRFNELLEYIAIKEHISGKTSWENSEFCARFLRYIKLGYHSKRCINPDTFVKEQIHRIDSLIRSISKKGVKMAPDAYDNISINIGRERMLLFNNRGHHRLSIAQCLNIEKVPVLVVVRHESTFNLK